MPIKDADKPDRRPSSLSPFRHRIFLAVWIASLASNFGGLIQSVGAAWLMTSIGAGRSHRPGAGLDDAADHAVLAHGRRHRRQLRPAQAHAHFTALPAGGVGGLDAVH